MVQHWCRRTSAHARLSVALRDIWQKYPKEVELGRDGLTLHFWPAHGWRAFKLDDELAIRNIYNSGVSTRAHCSTCICPTTTSTSSAPITRRERSSAGRSMRLNGNARASPSRMNSCCCFRPRRRTPPCRSSAVVPRDPARPPPRPNGMLHAGDGPHRRRGSRDVRGAGRSRRTVLALAHALRRTRERIRHVDLARHTHTYWDVAGDSAELHRVLHNSHYHEVGQTWLMQFRTGSPDLLRWARGEHRALDEHRHGQLCRVECRRSSRLQVPPPRRDVITARADAVGRRSLRHGTARIPTPGCSATGPIRTLSSGTGTSTATRARRTSMTSVGVGAQIRGAPARHAARGQHIAGHGRHVLPRHVDAGILPSIHGLA